MGFRFQNSLQSKIDQTSKISKSVFISNFPDDCLSRDLWKVCNGYGTVVDVFIPNKRSKAGKRFAFVRFINVLNLDRLIENLKTIWIGRFHLSANTARFERPKASTFQKEKPVPSATERRMLDEVVSDTTFGGDSVEVQGFVCEQATMGSLMIRSIGRGGKNSWTWMVSSESFSKGVKIKEARVATIGDFRRNDYGGSNNRLFMEGYTKGTWRKISGTQGEQISLRMNWRSVFNSHGANAFNSFISNSGLNDIQLEGFSFTWAHPSATKMSKLDRFLMSNGLLSAFPLISAICLDRHLSDHRPILLKEVFSDFGPTPFRFYHSWLELPGFDDLVSKSLERSFILMIPMVGLSKDLKSKLCDIDKVLDQGGVTDDILLSRLEVLKQLHDVQSSNNRDIMQKAKIRWAIEGDENSKYFHAIINKKRVNLSVKGIMVDGDWIVEPDLVKQEFRRHFTDRFQDPGSRRACGVVELIKSPGPDGFTFEFFRKYWTVVGPDFCIAVKWFFDHGGFAIGCNSSFVALIPKVLDPKVVVRKIVWSNGLRRCLLLRNSEVGSFCFFALNRALIFKWVCRYLSHDNSLCSRIISALHGLNGHVLSAAFNSTWSSIITEVNSLKVKGVDLISHCKIRVGKGTGTSFWKDLWIAIILLKLSFPHWFALEENNDHISCFLADKIEYVYLSYFSVRHVEEVCRVTTTLISFRLLLVRLFYLYGWQMVLGLNWRWCFYVKDVRSC
ncbi:RNA-directed DNA polymerase, eukaryota [Tanacetum coccineum]